MLGSRNDAASSSGSLHAKATDIKNGVNSLLGRSTFPAVKNIQRGRAWIDYSKNNNSVSISSVNTSKSILIFSFHGNMFISTSRNSGSDAYSGGIN